MTVRFPPGRRLSQTQGETPGVSGYQTPAELREVADIMAVALAQPHRKALNGCAPTWVAELGGRPLENALGRFCASPKRMYPKGLGVHCYQAGECYRGDVVEYLRAKGLEGGHRESIDRGIDLEGTEEEREARQKARVRVMEEKVDKADGVVRGVWAGAVSAIKRLCCDERDPPWQEEGILIGALSALSVFYHTAPTSIRDRDA